jgi:hypothetical protein
MYKARFKQKIKYDSEKGYDVNCVLVAKFDFRKEVAPEKKDKIEKRISEFKDSFLNPLKFDVPDAAFLYELQYTFKYLNNHKFSGRGLKFKIYFPVNKEINRDKIIDLDGINNFILDI